MKLKTILLTSVLAVSGLAVAANAADMHFTSALKDTVKATIESYAGTPIAPNATTSVPYGTAYTACALAGATQNCDFLFTDKVTGEKLYEIHGIVTTSSVTVKTINYANPNYTVSTTAGKVTPLAVGDKMVDAWIAPVKK